MKTKLAIVSAIMTMFPYLAASAGETRASSSATLHGYSQATTENPNKRGNAITPNFTPAKKMAGQPALLRARTGSKVRYYYPGYRKPGLKRAKTAKTAHWQTRNWN